MSWPKTKHSDPGQGSNPNHFELLWTIFVVPVVPESENAKDLWEAIKPEVQATIEEYLDHDEIIDEDDGPVEFQGDLDTALEW